MKDYSKFKILAPISATLHNLLLAYMVYFVARMVYLLVNYSYFQQSATSGKLIDIFCGGLVFDTSAILVTNIPYILLVLLLICYFIQ